MHVHPTPLKTLMPVTSSRELSFGQLAMHITRMRKGVVSLAEARLYKALQGMERRLNFNQNASTMVFFFFF